MLESLKGSTAIICLSLASISCAARRPPSNPPTEPPLVSDVVPEPPPEEFSGQIGFSFLQPPPVATSDNAEPLVGSNNGLSVKLIQTDPPSFAEAPVLPAYPPQALAEKIESTIAVQIDIDEWGRITDIKPYNHDAWGQAKYADAFLVSTIQAVATWRLNAAKVVIEIPPSGSTKKPVTKSTGAPWTSYVGFQFRVVNGEGGVTTQVNPQFK